MPRRLWLLAAIALGSVTAGIAFGTGCGQGDMPLESVDPAAAPLDPTYDQVAAITFRSCVPCHRGNNKIMEGDDDGENESPDLSTCQGVLDNQEGVERTIRDGTMPPGAWPRLSEAEKLLVQRWYFHGSCP